MNAMSGSEFLTPVSQGVLHRIELFQSERLDIDLCALKLLLFLVRWTVARIMTASMRTFSFDLHSMLAGSSGLQWGDTANYSADELYSHLFMKR